MLLFQPGIMYSPLTPSVWLNGNINGNKYPPTGNKYKNDYSLDWLIDCSFSSLITEISILVMDKGKDR